MGEEADFMREKISPRMDRVVEDEPARLGNHG
jgi:hypothetical protein